MAHAKIDLNTRSLYDIEVLENFANGSVPG